MESILVVGGRDSGLQCFDWHTLDAVHSCSESAHVWDIEQIGDSWTVATSSFDRTIRLWNLDPEASLRESLCTLTGHRNFTRDLSSVRWGGRQLLFSASNDRRIGVWDIDKCELLGFITDGPHEDYIHGCHYVEHRPGNVADSGSVCIKSHRETVLQISSDAKHDLAVTVSNDSHARLWDLRTISTWPSTKDGRGWPLWPPVADFILPASAKSLGMDPDNSLMLVGDSRGFVHVYDLRMLAHRLAGMPFHHGNIVRRIRTLDSSRSLYSSIGEDGRVVVFNLSLAGGDCDADADSCVVKEKVVECHSLSGMCYLRDGLVRSGALIGADNDDMMERIEWIAAEFADRESSDLHLFDDASFAVIRSADGRRELAQIWSAFLPQQTRQTNEVDAGTIEASSNGDVWWLPDDCLIDSSVLDSFNGGFILALFFGLSPYLDDRWPRMKQLGLLRAAYFTFRHFCMSDFAHACCFSASSVAKTILIKNELAEIETFRSCLASMEASSSCSLFVTALLLAEEPLEALQAAVAKSTEFFGCVNLSTNIKEASKRLLNRLWRSAGLTGDASLMPKDGRRGMRVHLPVLLIRSAFLRSAVRFGGTELDDLRSSRTLMLSTLTEPEAALFLRWAYDQPLPEGAAKPSMQCVLAVLTHAAMFQDNSLFHWMEMMLASWLESTGRGLARAVEEVNATGLASGAEDVKRAVIRALRYAGAQQDILETLSDSNGESIRVVE